MDIMFIGIIIATLILSIIIRNKKVKNIKKGIINQISNMLIITIIASLLANIYGANWQYIYLLGIGFSLVYGYSLSYILWRLKKN